MNDYKIKCKNEQAGIPVQNAQLGQAGGDGSEDDEGDD